MGNRTKIYGATKAAQEKVKGGYNPFNNKKTKCTANGCNVPAKPGAAVSNEKSESVGKP